MRESAQQPGVLDALAHIQEIKEKISAQSTSEEYDQWVERLSAIDIRILGSAAAAWPRLGWISDLAKELGTTNTAVMNQYHRLREEYQALG